MAMATPSQSHRYIGPPPVPGTFDSLNRILADLCTRGNPKVHALTPTLQFSLALATLLPLKLNYDSDT